MILIESSDGEKEKKLNKFETKYYNKKIKSIPINMNMLIFKK